MTDREPILERVRGARTRLLAGVDLLGDDELAFVVFLVAYLIAVALGVTAADFLTGR